VVCIRQDSAYDRIAKISWAFVWHLAKDLVRTVCVRVKTESVCLVGRTERDGVYARRLGDVERVLEKDLRSLVVLALGFDRAGKKESEKTASAWRRYVDVGISMVESTCESAVGKGRDSRCNGSEDEEAWHVCRRMLGRSWERGGEYGWGPVLEDVREVLSRWQM